MSLSIKLMIALVSLLSFNVVLTAPEQHTDQAFGSSFLSVVFANPTLHSVSVDKITSVEVGQQSVIKIAMQYHEATESTFAIIVEIRDSNDVTTYLSWQSGKVDGNGNYTMESSWTPTQGCAFPNEACDTYQIRTFVITDIDNPQILSAIYSIDGITVFGSKLESRSPLYYSLIVDNQAFQIAYSFSHGNGRISSIEVDESTKSMVFQLVTPQDSELSVNLPKQLVSLLFDETTLGDGLAIFVDAIPVDARQETNTATGSLGIVMPLKAGAEDVEILGSFLI